MRGSGMPVIFDEFAEGLKASRAVEAEQQLGVFPAPRNGSSKGYLGTIWQASYRKVLIGTLAPSLTHTGTVQ